MPTRFRASPAPLTALVAALLAALLAVFLVVAGCGSGAPKPAGTPTASISARVSAPNSASVSPSGIPPTPGLGSTLANAPFAGTVEVLPEALLRRMTGVSWRPGCPVPISELRLLRLSYVDFDGNARQGELVVHRAIADATVRVFGKLYAARFPIRSMTLIEQYGGSDDASMAADNTSAFNCRNVPNTTHWSNHAYGRAIDINAVENPYLPGGQIMPPAGKDYLDRRNVRPGMIVAGDVVVRAFRAEGFTWGGGWGHGIDYQHFEKPA